MKILLDTCTFLWLIRGSKELSQTSREAFTSSANEVYLSAVSAWEINVKHALGRLPLPQSPGVFIHRERQRHLISALPLSEQDSSHLGKLPALHKDPFDRMLVCQAIENSLVILGPDPLIEQYPVRCLW